MILASSESFVLNWLMNLMGSDSFQAFVVGHLSKEEANEYWDKHVVSMNMLKYVYGICGGSQYLLLKVYNNYI